MIFVSLNVFTLIVDRNELYSKTLFLQSGFRQCKWLLCSSCSLYSDDSEEAKNQTLICVYLV